MRLLLFMTGGFGAGLLAAGLANAVLVTVLPEAQRSAQMVWAAATIIIVIAMSAAWILFRRRS